MGFIVNKYVCVCPFFITGFHLLTSNSRWWPLSLLDGLVSCVLFSYGSHAAAGEPEAELEGFKGVSGPSETGPSAGGRGDVPR